MVRLAALILLNSLIMTPACAGMLSLSLIGDSVPVSKLDFQVLVNEEKVGKMKGTETFEIKTDTKKELFIRVFDSDKDVGGYQSIIVPDKGHVALTVTVKTTGVNKPAYYEFSAIHSEVLAPQFTVFKLTFFDQYHPGEVVKVGEIWDVKITNGVKPFKMVRAADLFRISKGGVLEVSNIDEFKSMLSKMEGRIWLEAAVLSEDNDTLFAEAMFTYQ